uniref:G domain-containing protein n=1 Tax=Chromera velia CCMP2878 TaxID=1169474 RepID=A0A0G4GGR0_9ALVE|eukprot:Cvel_4665.t1-p1 / transcript=Cvel_4665.t1 / gene=Cvel_4665 / organism=Chromera_velia_CCMP2878 / gene_product=Uncharacterized protein MJ1408, putative / transcript_product=Uncharacterized protein MJ1408, putative / location=Cvel_scaffold206:22317-28544(-) / protein_length=584 / sequence_SO=supercontig / SO=protein_coding / is_pseudo=false
MRWECCSSIFFLCLRCTFLLLRTGEGFAFSKTKTTSSSKQGLNPARVGCQRRGHPRLASLMSPSTAETANMFLEEYLATSAGTEEDRPPISVDTQAPPRSRCLEIRGRFEEAARAQQRRERGPPLLRKATLNSLQKVPESPALETVLKRARAELWKVQPDKKEGNLRKRTRKYAAERLDVFTKALTADQSTVVKRFKSLHRGLHPFESVLADLTVKHLALEGVADVDSAVFELNEQRKRLLNIGKSFASRAAAAESAEVAHKLLEEGLELLETEARAGEAVVRRMETVQRRLRKLPILKLHLPSVCLVGVPNCGKSSIVRAVSSGKSFASRAAAAESAEVAHKLLEEGLELLETEARAGEAVVRRMETVQRRLRKLPILKLHLPSVCLVGVPNCGKSSIVRAVSSGEPEVNDYVFTTRGVSIGHVFEDSEWGGRGDGGRGVQEILGQVMDTPGLLNRGDPKRNEMEAMTFAALRTVPSAVIYVFDLTGANSLLTTLQDQIDIRNMLRERFPKRPWLDVCSKCDVVSPEHVEQVPGLPQPMLRISAHDGTGLPTLRKEVKCMLRTIKNVLEPVYQEAIEPKRARS